MKLLDLDAIAKELREAEELCAQAGCSCTTATVALKLVNENRLLRERLKLEEQTHGCAR